MTDLERAAAFEEFLRDAGVERREPTPFGDALFNDGYPRVWTLNVLRADGSYGAEARSLAAEAERRQAHLGHRRILLPDDTEGRRLEHEFGALGWKPDRFLFMVLRRAPQRSADVSLAVEVERDRLRELRTQAAGHEPWAEDDETVRQVAESTRYFHEAGRARHFAVVDEGRPVAACDLYSDGRTAQVEEVVTLPAFRGRGYASALVVRASEEAKSAGHDFVFLTADATDWPKDLYRELGFEDVGQKWAFLRIPAGPGETPPEARVP